MPIAVATMPGPAFVDPSEVIKHKANRIADNHMYELKVPAKLPVREAVGSFPKSVDPVAVAQKWLDSFENELVKLGDSSVGNTFLPNGTSGDQDFNSQPLLTFGPCYLGVWRDRAIFTGDYRTITGTEAINAMASVCFPRFSNWGRQFKQTLISLANSFSR